MPTISTSSDGYYAQQLAEVQHKANMERAKFDVEKAKRDRAQWNLALANPAGVATPANQAWTPPAAAPANNANTTSFNSVDTDKARRDAIADGKTVADDNQARRKQEGDINEEREHRARRQAEAIANRRTALESQKAQALFAQRN